MYRVYVTDALKLLSENTARYAGGSHMMQRWEDVVTPKKRSTRTGAEIAADVIKKAGLKVVSKAESV